MEYFPFTINQLCLWIFGALLLTAAASDVRAYSIPNRLTAAIAALYVPYVISVPGAVDWTAALQVAGTVLVAGFILFAANQMGGGDIKLATAVALWAGPEHVLPFVLLTALAGGVVSAAVLLHSRYGWVVGFGETKNGRNVPYGVAIAAGGLYVTVSLLGR